MTKLVFALFYLMPLFSFAALPSTYDGKKQSFERVIASQDLARLNQFIDDYNGTGWDTTAIWHRDKMAVDTAKKDGSVGAFISFLKKYPDSDWFNHVVYFRDRSAYRQAKMLNTLNAYDEFLENYPNSEWQLKVIKRREKLLHPSIKQKPRSTPVLVNNKPYKESAEVRRNREALAVYQTIADQRQQLKQEKQKIKDRQQTKLRSCHRMKDNIHRYDERIRWYKLNPQGERQYLMEDEVQSAKQALTVKYQKRCG